MSDQSRKAAKGIIVIVWMENDGMRQTGRTVRRDLNYFPEFEACPQAHAVVWLNRGTDKDLAKAREHAATMTYPNVAVFNLPTSTRDPLAVAKARIMEKTR